MVVHLAPVGCGQLVTRCGCTCSHCGATVAACGCVCKEHQHPIHTVCDCARPEVIRADQTPEPQPTAVRWFSDDYVAYRPYTGPYAWSAYRLSATYRR